MTLFLVSAVLVLEDGMFSLSSSVSSCDCCVPIIDIDNVCNELLLFTVKLVH